MKIAVFGAGAYGCYTIDALIKKFPEAQITLFDVGNSHIKSEKEIGYLTNMLSTYYSGLEKGRFFGLGGATSRWGGQLLTFTKNDFKNPTPFLSDIVKLNVKYQEIIFKKFGIHSEFKETKITNNLFIKKGVWLSYFNRNLFKYFKINKRKNVVIKSNSRVTKLILNNNKAVTRVIYKQGNIEKEDSFDFYFLTTGAFESNRILLNSGLTDMDELPFSDHLSQKVFKIKDSTIIQGEDFAFKVNGSSLITKRIIGEIDGISFFSNPIFNSEFSFFQDLKKVLFKRKLSFKIIKNIILELPSCLQFIYCMLVKKKIYVHKNEWYLYIDIENPINKSFISLSKNQDKFEEKGLDVSFFIDENAVDIFEKAKEMIKDYLIKNEINFEECVSTIQVEKSEDTYHPFGIMSSFNSMDEFYNQYENFCFFNTGILPRAGGINTTASVFPLIEEFINNYME
ncbi:hypothetical protein [Winogradskyella ludwigii]|uniref:hypothetical protein n=1 Tax=Winogradskyella ludwigii TaxID=2686076 RepID=UPI0015CC6AD0|nr:hypothetical protein [Winogradskyella ludwigii]